jgi:hypothetical protein
MKQVKTLAKKNEANNKTTSKMGFSHSVQMKNCGFFVVATDSSDTANHIYVYGSSKDVHEEHKPKGMAQAEYS